MNNHLWGPLSTQTWFEYFLGQCLCSKESIHNVILIWIWYQVLLVTHDLQVICSMAYPAHILRHSLEFNTSSSLSPLHFQNKSYPQCWDLVDRIHGWNNIVTLVNKADKDAYFPHSDGYGGRKFSLMDFSEHRFISWSWSQSRYDFFIPLLANHTEEIYPI